jgi:sugar (pentulose or hexulose) kinase
MFLKMMNLMDSVLYTITEAEINWIKQNQKEIWDKTDKFLFLSGYLTFRLTGEFRDSSANQVGFVPFDYKKQEWAGKRHHYWKMLDIPEDVLPELVQPGEIIGTITSRASEDTGIPEGLPLIAAATDKACEVLGAGCLTPETACLSYGTTATVETTNEKYVEIIPFIPPFPSAVPGSYNTEVMVYRGFWLVSWFKKEFGLKEREIAKKRKITPEKLFDDLVREIPPGSLGLTLQPYWSPGVKIPGAEAKGAIIGFGDVHTRAHFYRAILEGLVYALKEGAMRTEKRNRVKIEKVKVSGGGSQSDVAMQITADIFNMTAERPSTYETSALGAAIDAAVGLKLHSDFKSAVNDMTGVNQAFDPIKENSEIYSDLYERIYLKLYKKLKPFYEDIMDITGYPSAR